MSIQSVDRALQILSLFSHRRPQLGIAEIGREIDLPKGTVHGLVRTLLGHGFLHQDATTRKYRLGLKIHELGMVLAGTLEINEKSAGPCRELAARTGLIARIAIWDGDSVVITLNMHPTAHAAIPAQIGPRVHAYCSAIGKAILAFLDEPSVADYLDRARLVAITPATITEKDRLLDDLAETRERGYSIDREEAVRGLGCIGAPLYAREGSVAGSLSLSGPSRKVLGNRLEPLGEELLKTAGEISHYMGYVPSAY